MNFKDHCRVRTDGSRVIVECCFIGGADFAQFRTGCFDDFANSKAAADLHQFATRNNDISFGSGEMSNNQHERCCAIVHYSRRFCSAK